MKERIVIAFLTILATASTLAVGYSYNKFNALENEINKKDQRIKEMELLVEEKNREVKQLTQNKGDEYISMTYIENNEKRRFVEKAAHILALPRLEAAPLRGVEENAVVEINDMVLTGKGEMWLYVTIPVYDGPTNMKGWLKESDTVPYTKEKQKLVRSDIVIKEGTPVFQGFEFNANIHTALAKVNGDKRGRIGNRKEGYVRLDCPGGETIWVEEKYLIYPKVQESEST